MSLLSRVGGLKQTLGEALVASVVLKVFKKFYKVPPVKTVLRFVMSSKCKALCC